MDTVSQFRYRPAGGSGWLAVATPGRLLVVHPDAADTAVAVFERSYEVGSGQGFQAALDELTRGGLSATPPFALLEWSEGANEGSLRAIVRGGVKVVVAASGSDHTLDGTGVSTWTEQGFRSVTAFEVSIVPAPEDAFTGDRWLPFDNGITVAARVASGGPSPQGKDKPSVPERAAAPATPKSTRAQPSGEVSEATMSDLPVAAENAPAELDSNARPTDEGYDYHFGETMYRSAGDASAREPDPVEAPAAGAPVGDHDGMTVMNSDLKKLRENRKAKSADAPPAAAPTAAQLYLELSTGSREALSQPVLVGRAPTASKVSSGALPRLVTIPGDKDISRNHAQFAVEGGTVVVTDLHSRNGTQVIMPGKPPQQLRQGEPTAVIVGTVVDLGGGVTLTVREEG
jgi:hypothetical protein